MIFMKKTASRSSDLHFGSSAFRKEGHKRKSLYLPLCAVRCITPPASGGRSPGPAIKKSMP